MRLLGITDVHGKLGALDRILKDAGPVDAVLFGGDLTTFGTPDEAEKAIELARASGTTVYAVAGNCDSPEIDERLDRLGVSLHRRGVVLGRVGLHGLSAIPPWQRRMYQFTEEELGAALQEGYAAVNRAEQHCVLAHVPPHGLSLDRVFFGRHAGSRALRRFVEETEPCLVVCGHVHEGYGLEALGPTTVVNCGSAARGKYALIDLDDEVTVQLRRA
jgi:Icc-related predicted phosphoesterase